MDRWMDERNSSALPLYKKYLIHAHETNLAMNKRITVITGIVFKFTQLLHYKLLWVAI